MFRRYRLFLLPALVTLTLAGCALVSPPSRATDPAPADAWVESTLAGLSVREKVGQMVFPWIGGDYLAVESDAYDGLRDWVVEHGIGGVVVSIGPPLEVASKLNLLQEMADVPLLVTADLEHGPGQRLNGGVVLPYGLEVGGGTEFPPVMALGAAGDPELAYEMGRVTALEARAVGIHVDLAPVMDVNNNPANPIINVRSYGADPEAVARLASAQIRGLQENGLLATAKHFPGHGDTGTDSHIELPILTVDRARVDAMELVPFRAGIDAGVAGVMVAHIAFPALTGDTMPATLSRELSAGLLREELGFDGLIITDALDMGGVVTRYGPAEAAVRAVKAGADILLMPTDVGVAIDAVVSAVEQGEIAEARVDRSVRKLLRTKADFGLYRGRTVDLAHVPEVVGSRSHLEVAQRAAERSITVARDRDGILPVDPLRIDQVLSIIYSDDPDPFSGRTFQRSLAERFAEVRTASIDARTGAAELDSLKQMADNADVVFFSPFVRVLARKGDVAIAEPVAAFVEAVAVRRPTVVTSFGNPYVLSQFPGVGTYVLAWGQEAVAQGAAARALVGEVAITGRLPIPIPPYHTLGEGLQIKPARVAGTWKASETVSPVPVLLSRTMIARPGPSLPMAGPQEVGEVGMDPVKVNRVDELMRDAIATGVTPGAAIAIGRHGKLVRLQGYGLLDWRDGFGPVTDSSIYDLASLTKVVGTTTALMLLVEEGKVDVDAPISRYVVEWPDEGEKARVTVRHLLTHSAGLPAFEPLWRSLRGRDAYLHRIVETPLEYSPGTRIVYSDFGAILAGFIVERVSDQRLDVVLQERIFGPLGMSDTGFNPLQWDEFGRAAAGDGSADMADGDAEAEVPSADILSRIAPTEVDTVFRGQHVHGVVHDENAYAMGGVAGHAGLFSSARDLAVFAQMLLNGGSVDGVRLLDSATIDRFTRRQKPGSSRALGWDTPSEHSSAGDYFSASSFGHTGFTGTSIWIDPERDVFVVLLTNRVNPTRENQRHVEFRRDVHDAVQQAIVDLPVTKRVDPK